MEFLTKTGLEALVTKIKATLSLKLDKTDVSDYTTPELEAVWNETESSVTEEYLGNIYTKSEIDDKLSNVEVDLSDYATKADLASASGYVTIGQKEGTTLGEKSTAEGNETTASGVNSHAEGYNTVASGIYTHAEGASTVASGARSHAGGAGTIAAGPDQTAIGKFNVEDETSLLIIGNGTTFDARSNALTVAENGDVTCGMVNGVDVSRLKYVHASSESYAPVAVVSEDAGIATMDFSGLPNNKVGGVMYNVLVQSNTGDSIVDSAIIAVNYLANSKFLKIISPFTDSSLKITYDNASNILTINHTNSDKIVSLFCNQI